MDGPRIFREFKFERREIALADGPVDKRPEVKATLASMK